jgi:hypothetical protein
MAEALPLIFSTLSQTIDEGDCLKLHLLKIIVDDDYPYEEHNTYVIDTNIIVVETDDDP